MPEIRLLAAEKTRTKLTVAQEQYIRKLYREALKEVENWSKELERKEKQHLKKKVKKKLRSFKRNV